MREFRLAPNQALHVTSYGICMVCLSLTVSSNLAQTLQNSLEDHRTLFTVSHLSRLKVLDRPAAKKEKQTDQPKNGEWQLKSKTNERRKARLEWTKVEDLAEKAMAGVNVVTQATPS